MIGLLFACSSPEPQPLRPPDLTLVITARDTLTDPPTFSLTDTHAKTQQTILTGTLQPGAQQNLPGILRLYGYQSGAFVGNDFLLERPDLQGAFDTFQPDACPTAQSVNAWLESAPSPTLLVLHVPQGCPMPPTRGETWTIGLGDLRADQLTDHHTRASLHGPGLGLLDTLQTTADVMPTLLSRAEATVPSDAEGHDLIGAIVSRDAIVQVGETTISLRTKQHRLVVNDRPLPPTLNTKAGALFDLQNDPNEDTNVITQLPTIAQAMYAALQDWEQQQQDPSARSRMGEDRFREILQDGGYWESTSRNLSDGDSE